MNIVLELRRAQNIFRKRGMPHHAIDCHRTRGALFDTRNPANVLIHAHHLIREARL